MIRERYPCVILVNYVNPIYSENWMFCVYKVSSVYIVYYPLQQGPPAAITGFFTVRRVPRIMLWTVFAIFFSKNN